MAVIELKITTTKQFRTEEDLEEHLDYLANTGNGSIAHNLRRSRTFEQRFFFFIFTTYELTPKKGVPYKIRKAAHA